GGTPTVVRELAIRLRKATAGKSITSDSVHVACLSEWGPVAYQIQDAAIPVTPLNAHSPRDVLVISRLVGLICQYGFGVVFSFLVHASAVAAAAARFVPQVRFIQSIQTTQPNPRWQWRNQRFAHWAAAKIVVPSQSVAQVAREWCEIPAEKIVIIPN